MKEGRISCACRGRVRRERVRARGLVRLIRVRGGGMGSRMLLRLGSRFGLHDLQRGCFVGGCWI